MSENKSIYEYIVENVGEDGMLPVHFMLPRGKENDNGMMGWMDGAKDGVAMYHVGISQPDDEQYYNMKLAIDSASNGEFDKAEKLFFRLGRSLPAVSWADYITQYVMEKSEEINASNLYALAEGMLRESRDKECVKFALELFELFDIDDEDLKQVMRTVALSDEFTIYVLWNVRSWDNANEEVFDIARKVRGWGRIHAIERLEPENEEIREWILFDGTKNSVMNSYSALTCWQKSGAEKRLEGKLTKGAYSAIAAIIDGLLDEGTVSGISELENKEDVLLKFVQRADDFELDFQEYAIINTIGMWAEGEEPEITSVAEACRKIVESEGYSNAMEEYKKKQAGTR